MASHKEEPKNVYFRSYSTQAKKLYLEKKYIPACELYSRSLEICPIDKHCLVARSKCFLRLGKPAKALADAQLALQQDENFAEAVYQKAEAYYQQSNYEVALLVLYQGLKLPGRPDIFLNGIHKCENAIEKSVHWLDELPIYRSEEPMECGKKEGYDESSSSEGITAEPNLPIPHRDKLQNLLEEIYQDRKFLKKLLKCVEFKTESDWLSKLIIIDRLVYLNNQAKYLQTQKLAYRTGKASTPQNIKDDLEEIQLTFSSKRYKDCIKECVRMAGDYKDTDWEVKRKFILKLYSWIGASNMELKQWEKARCAFLALLSIGEWCKDVDLRLKALGAISLCYKNDTQLKSKSGDKEEAESGEMSEIEEMDLYYYLGQCYLGLNNEKARGYGKMCYDTAVVGSSKEFMKSSLMLMAGADMKLGNHREAAESLKECEQLMTGDNDGRKESVEKALADVLPLVKDPEEKSQEIEKDGDEEDEEEEELRKKREKEKEERTEKEKSDNESQSKDKDEEKIEKEEGNEKEGENEGEAGIDDDKGEGYREEDIREEEEVEEEEGIREKEGNRDENRGKKVGTFKGRGGIGYRGRVPIKEEPINEAQRVADEEVPTKEPEPRDDDSDKKKPKPKKLCC